MPLDADLKPVTKDGGDSQWRGRAGKQSIAVAGSV